VQDFIATARTSQDLRFGSWMLSELSKAAAKSISTEPHQLIFPAPEKERDLDAGTTLSVANKIVAVVEGDPKAVADCVSQAVRERLKQLCQEAWEKIKDRVDKKLAEEQIDSLIEFYWASVPYTGEQNYAKERARVEALLAARKNTRNFRQIAGREGIPKSSLDGFRESVLPSKSKLMDDDEFYDAYHAEPEEALSGIDLLKRWGKAGEASFPSTTDVAAQPFRVMLGKEGEQALRGRIKALLESYTKRTETEGTYFYAERLTQLISDKAGRGEFRREFAKIFQEEGIRQRPSPYYALLLADGDNMGKTIDAQDDVGKHRELSCRLSEFASAAYQLIVDHGSTPVYVGGDDSSNSTPRPSGTKDHGSTPIYVGGDDVLAYLPLHTALQCVSALNHKFREYMEGFSYQVNGEPRSPTLSGALVIVHHLTPLGDVLETAREAERKAKRRSPEKNALVIVLSKRGGVERTASARMGDLLERMPVLIEYMRQKQISAGTAYELERLHRQLSEAELPEVAFRREAIRIIQRKREGGGGREVREQVREQFETWFKDKDLALNELAQEMIVAGEFAMAYEMASVPLDGGG
jgi:CRISPR-associated protein Cmr2